MRYLENRRLTEANDRKVWCFVGDGEMDEPESLGAISLAGRERLDNLIFVVNCNLQRLDGPVRAMAKLFRNLKAFSEGLAGTLLKSSGAGSGIRYSSVTKVVCYNSEWMRLSTAIIKTIRVIQAITFASTFLANT